MQVPQNKRLQRYCYVILRKHGSVIRVIGRHSFLPTYLWRLKARLSQSEIHCEGPWDNTYKSSLAIELGTKRSEMVLGIAVTMTNGGAVLT